MVHLPPITTPVVLCGPASQSAARTSEAAKEMTMMDLFMLALGAAFFAFGFAYTKICDRL